MVIDKPPPGLVFKLAMAITGFLQWLLDALTPPPALVMNKLTAFIGSAQIFEAAKLGITEAIGNHQEWLSVERLAERLGLDERICCRLLRGLYQNGFYDLQEKKGRLFVRNNVLSLTLHPDTKPSMKYMALHQGMDVMATVMDSSCGLDYSVKTAHDLSQPTGFHKKFGLKPFDFLRANPDRSETVNRAMQAVDNLGVGAMVEDHPWGQYKNVYDVGGGKGHFLLNILQTYKQPTGTVCDLEQPIKEGREEFEEMCNMDYKGKEAAKGYAALAQRVDFKAIDFFKTETIPKAKDGDCYMLRVVLHDFVDKDVKTILNNLRSAFGDAKATLVLVETIPEVARNAIQGMISMIDTVMLCLNGGGERNVQEWTSVLAESRFKFRSCTRTRSPFSVIVATPV